MTSGDKKPPRKRIDAEIEAAILIKSARRCPLCFHLDGDLREKAGQIAHLDNDRTNASEDNLAWMCMPHHSQYDSSTRQHKNYTIKEVKQLRALLYEAIARGDRRAAAVVPRTNKGTQADCQTLAKLLEVMAESGSIDFLRGHDFYIPFEWSQLDGIHQVLLWDGAEHEFIDLDLENLRVTFRTACTAFINCASLNTFVVGDNLQGIPMEWKIEYPGRIDRTLKELHAEANKLCAAYDELVRSARRKLNA